MGGRKLPYEDFHKVINNIEFKKCPDCLEWLEMNSLNFYNNKATQDGYNTWCKTCTKKRSWSNFKNDPTGEKKNKKAENMKEYASTTNGLLKRRKAVQKWREEGGQKEYYYNNPDKYKKYGHTNHDISKNEWEKCKEYFNYSCGYCGISEEDAKKEQGQVLHKEHVEHKGANDLSNCIPACKSCNSQKNTLEFIFWYKERCEGFSEERLDKIIKWIEIDYKTCLDNNRITI